MESYGGRYRPEANWKSVSCDVLGWPGSLKLSGSKTSSCIVIVGLDSRELKATARGGLRLQTFWACTWRSTSCNIPEKVGHHISTDVVLKPVSGRETNNEFMELQLSIVICIVHDHQCCNSFHGPQPRIHQE